MSEQGHWYTEGAPPVDQLIEEPPRSNWLGLTGFIVSIVGLCASGGLLSPVGLVLSVIGLFKRPKGFAIAGTIVSLLGFCCLPVSIPTILIASGASSSSKVGMWAERTFSLDPDGKTFVRIAVLSTEIPIYAARNNGSIPSSLDQLNVEPEGLKDGWGNPFKYELDDKGGFLLWSAGRDGSEGTADDIELIGVNRGGSIQVVPNTPGRRTTTPGATPPSAAPKSATPVMPPTTPPATPPTTPPTTPPASAPGG